MVVASKSGKSGKGEGEGTFETPPPEKPFLAGPFPIETTTFEATFEAYANPEYQETSCVLISGIESSLEHGTTVPCEPANLGDEGSLVVPKVTITGLEPGTTYHYRMILENATTILEGVPVEGAGELKTPTVSAPLIESVSASPSSSFAATLEAKVNPEYQETKCEEFEYSAVKATVEAKAGTHVACNPENLGKGGSGVGVSAAISGLEKSTIYYYRLIKVKNATGEAAGTIEHFETASGSPVLLREYEEGDSVVGGINSEGEPTSCYVEYTATESETVAKKILQEEKTGTKNSCEPAIVNGQQEARGTPALVRPNTEYYLHVYIENKATEEKHTRVEETTGNGCCGNQLFHFRTGAAQPPQPPTVAKEHTSEVTALHAKLEAEVNPNSQKTIVEFEYSSEGRP